LVATTNPQGAGKWRPEYNEHLRDRDVVLLPDNDDAGRKHAEHVVSSLHGIAANIRITTLPGLSLKEDVSDWLVAGHTVAELDALVAATPVWTPTATSGETEAVDVFDAKDRFIPARLGTRLVAESTIRLGHDRRLWRYANGV